MGERGEECGMVGVEMVKEVLGGAWRVGSGDEMPSEFGSRTKKRADGSSSSGRHPLYWILSRDIINYCRCVQCTVYIPFFDRQ